MPWTQADVDALKAAIATGAQTIRTADGRTLTRPPIAESLLLLQVMENEVNANDPNATPPVGLMHAGHRTGVE
jgi:hypothetical protein